MDIPSIKVDLIRWLAELQDRETLEKLQALKQQQEVGLGEAHKDLLNERIASYEKNPGKTLEWDGVMKEFKDQ